MSAIVIFLATVSAKASLVPNGPWYVETGDGVCIVSRDFGSGDNAVSVEFRPVFTASFMGITIISGSSDDVPPSGKLNAEVKPSGQQVEGTYRSALLLPGNKQLTSITVPSTLWADIRHGGELSIAGKISVQLVLSGADKAGAAFGECESNLLRSWSIDPARLAPDRPPEARTPLAGFMPDDYPADAMQAGVGGRAVALLSVDAKGGVEACRIVVSVAASLDRATCLAGSRMRFKPASDAGGRPVPSLYVLPVNWIPPQ